MNNKILCTFGVGNHAAYLDITRPFFEEYADRHGYDYTERYIDTRRPPAWGKVALLLDVLDEYDEALWIDSDVVIVDGSLDVADHIPKDKWQAMSLHTEFLGQSLGTIPSTGFWFVRQPMVRALEDCWMMTDCLNHIWWEQAAMHKLLGYGSEGANHFPVVAKEPTPLRAKTHFLEDRWHSLDIHNLASDAYSIHVPAFGHGARMFHLIRWAIQAHERKKVASVA